jgi:hypothetical protein
MVALAPLKDPPTPALIAPATYHDSRREQPGAPDISRAVVARGPHGTITFTVRVPNRPALTGDMGFEVLIDGDRSEATGDRSLRLGMGVDDLVTILAGQARLQRPRGGVWRTVGVPAYSYTGGVLTVTLRAPGLGRPPGFSFAVSAASGLVPQPDGSIEITNASFDFAPDDDRPAWIYPSPGAR